MNGYGEENVLLQNVMLWGPTGWGKSALLAQLTSNSFTENSASTTSVEFGLMNYSIQDRNVNLDIWDTAGEERFLSIGRSYLPRANAVIVPCDVTKMPTNQNDVFAFINEAKENSHRNTLIILAFTKCDLVDENVLSSIKSNVQTMLKKKLDFKINLIFDTSAKENTGITELFTTIAKQLVSQNPLQESQENGQSCEFNMLTILFYAACTLTPLVGWGCLFYELFNYLESLELFSCNSSAKTDKHNLSMR